MMRFAMVSILQKLLPWTKASSVLPLKSVMRSEREPSRVGAEVCPEAWDAEEQEQRNSELLECCAGVIVPGGCERADSV